MTSREIHFLHIGKTGGSSVKDYWTSLQASLPPESRMAAVLHVHSHDTNLESVVAQDPHARIAFIYREPLERFVSAFYSRLRNGRPRYDSVWSVEEAISFGYFATADDLLDALDGDDERMQSAARFALQHVSHLKRDFSHYLGGVETLEKFRENIVFACELTTLDERVHELFSLLVDEPVGGWPSVSRAHVGNYEYRSSAPPGPALEAYLSKDQAIYDWLRRHFPAAAVQEKV